MPLRSDDDSKYESYLKQHEFDDYEEYLEHQYQREKKRKRNASYSELVLAISIIVLAVMLFIAYMSQ